MDNEPRLPEKGEYVRYHGVLLDVKTIQPPTPKPYVEYVFEERSARKELRFKDGSVLEVIETLNDFFGLGTGEKSAIKELEALAKKKGIGKKSDVEAVVVREVRRYVAKPKKEPNFYDKTFFDFEPYHSETENELENEQVDVWSSKRGIIKRDEVKHG
jgi:hypothetical protein